MNNFESKNTLDVLFPNNFELHTNHSPLSGGRKYEILKATVKFNSHCHLGGEIPIDTLLKYATIEQKNNLESALSEIKSKNEYEAAFRIFPLISQIINTHEKLQEAAYQTCLRFKQDNNQAVLMRTGLKKLENENYEKYLTTVLDGIQKAISENFNVFLMLSLKRSSSLEMANTTIELALKYRERGVIGIDISDISTIGNIEAIIPELCRAKENGLKIAVHMGESAKEEDQMLIINNLKPDLIDHGVNLCEEAKKWVISEKIPVTVCLTSSIATNMHDCSERHPWIIECVKNNHLIHLGTDDSTVFGDICLSDEFSKLCSHLELEKVVEIANRSFDSLQSFLGNTTF